MFPRVGQQECHQGPAVDRNYADCVLLPRADDSEAGFKKKKNRRQASFAVHSALLPPPPPPRRMSRVINSRVFNSGAPLRPAPLITRPALQCELERARTRKARVVPRARNVLFPPFSLPSPSSPSPPPLLALVHVSFLGRPERSTSALDS